MSEEQESILRAHGIKAIFSDGSSHEGALLVGLDGAHSAVRATLCPAHPKPDPLPVHLLGLELTLTRAQIAPLIAMDPVVMLGDSPFGICGFFAVLASPEVTAPPEGAPGVPEGNDARIALLRERLSHMWREMRDAVEGSITPETTINTLTIADWVVPDEGWDNLGGRVTLAGDAAHTMTMFRGEGFNNAVLDVANLVSTISEIYSTPTVDEDKRAALITEYDAELCDRSPRVVIASRQQCFMIHDWEKYEAWTKASQWGAPHQKV
ncbi:hypothetical protein OE88DRAFT_1740352 [Heliocybe sulcata]|uniref:FAD-binding domain-containing protein n=1 Tax=Heliocybe sulcata TaxID=5364 RepID=A0A5C3MKW4_9AGAM|nr:hypothetical protein OE88DRAFT_1740352 [Heliocybe sulcata]